MGGFARRLAWIAGCCGLVAALWTRTTAHERITTTVTWDREVSAIVRARCLGCHVEGGRAPMPLATYAEARPWARAIKHEVLTRRMPIWHAARGFGDFANDPSLSPFEIALITAWVDGGAPKTVPSAPPAGTASTEIPRIEPAVAPGDEIAVRCAEQAALRGTLLGLRPRMLKGASLRVSVLLPGNRHEILGWFRDFDPEFAPTYWLRTPLVVPAGSRLLIDGRNSAPDCSVTLTMSRR